MPRRLRIRPGRSEEGSAARILRNSLANGLGGFAGVAITLFLTPLLIDRLGTAAYGTWVLATSLTFTLGYLSFAELGIETGAVRFIAEARKERDAGEVNRVVTTSLAMYLGLGAVLTPVMVAVAAPLSGVFDIPESLRDDARATFTIIAAQLFLDLSGRAFSAVIQGAQRYGVWQALELTQVVATAALFGVVVLSGGGIVELALASVAIAGLMLALNMTAAFLVTRELRLSPRRFDPVLVRRIGSYGGQLVLFRLGGLVYRQTDKTVLGIALGASLVTTYEIAFKVQAAAAMVQGMVTSTLIPAVAYDRSDPARLREMLTRGTAYAMALATPFVIAAFVFADPVIRTWIGDGFDDSVTPTRIFLGVLVVSSAISVGQAIMSGLGRIRPMLVLAAVWIVLNLALSLALVGPLGVEGVILATLVSESFVALPLLRLFLRELGVPARSFVRRVFVPLVPAAAAQALASWALLGVAESTGSLFVVAALALPGMALFALVYVFVGLDPADREKLRGTLRQTLGLQSTTQPAPALRDEIPGGDPPATPGIP